MKKDVRHFASEDVADSDSDPPLDDQIRSSVQEPRANSKQD